MLIVDDSADIREMWRVWLSFWGFSVDEARNGYEAVEKARRFTPDLILLDLWMPVIDGIEAMHQLKADGRTAAIPILALSAQSHCPDASTAIAAGAQALLQKPCDPDQLLTHIRHALSKGPSA